MNHQLHQQCLAGCFSGAMNFGQVVGHMIADGVEWFSANLLLGATTYFASDGSHDQTPWPTTELPAITNTFSEELLVAAIRGAQKGEVGYPEFLKKIAWAGVVYYTVHMTGRKAIYFGRHGDFHVETFPGK